MERKVELVNTRDKAVELGEGRKGLNAVNLHPAQGVTIVPDADSGHQEGQSDDQPDAGPTVSASDAKNGPSDFDC